MTITTLLTAFWAFTSSLFFHPAHVGLVQIDYAEEVKSLQVVHKYFVDDIEEAIYTEYGVQLYLGTDKEHPEKDVYLKKYFDAHFQVILNGSKLKEYDWVGFEADVNAIWVYQEFFKVKKIKAIAFENSILFDQFEDQQNLIKFSFNGQKKSLITELGKSMGEIDL